MCATLPVLEKQSPLQISPSLRINCSNQHLLLLYLPMLSHARLFPLTLLLFCSIHLLPYSIHLPYSPLLLYKCTFAVVFGLRPCNHCHLLMLLRGPLIHLRLPLEMLFLLLLTLSLIMSSCNASLLPFVVLQHLCPLFPLCHLCMRLFCIRCGW